MLYTVCCMLYTAYSIQCSSICHSIRNICPGGSWPRDHVVYYSIVYPGLHIDQLCAAPPAPPLQPGGNWSESISQSISRAITHTPITLLASDNLLGNSLKPLPQVLVPSAGIRGFLDASEFGTWLKFVRRDGGAAANVRHVLLGGQIFYQTVRRGGVG